MVALCACAPLTTYHRAGVPVAKMESELLACRVNALEKAPVATQVRRGAPIYVPGYRYCNSAGHCYRRGGYYAPGNLYTVDVNAPLRRDVEQQCMASQGYSAVTIPNCPAGSKITGQAATITNSPGTASKDILPPLTAQTCAVKGEGGAWKIITPLE